MIFKDKALTISVNYYFKIHFANKTETKKTAAHLYGCGSLY